MFNRNRELFSMTSLPEKPSKPFDELMTSEQQDLHSSWCKKEILDPYHKEGVPLPTIDEANSMFDSYIEKLYSQPDPK